MIKKSIHINEVIPQENGQFTIVFQDKNGKLLNKTNCSFCCFGDATLMDEEIFTVHFEHIIPYDDIDNVCKEYSQK